MTKINILTQSVYSIVKKVIDSDDGALFERGGRNLANLAAVTTYFIRGIAFCDRYYFDLCNRRDACKRPTKAYF